MKIRFPKEFSHDGRTLIRRCGYGEIFNRETGQPSYVRRLGQYHYPRFHIYIEEKPGELVFNLHLDAKQPSYQNQKAHSGEYEGEVVEREGERIKGVIENRGAELDPVKTKERGFGDFFKKIIKLKN